MKEKEHLEELRSEKTLEVQEEKVGATGGRDGRKRLGEAGADTDGGLSLEAVRQWLLWAGRALGICLAASCVLGMVFLVQNRKPAVILAVDEKDGRELVLNRKGVVIRKIGNPGPMRGLSLRECCTFLLEELYGKQMLEEQEAVLITVRPMDGTARVDTKRMAENIAVAAELFLTTRQAKGSVYIGSISEEPEIMKLSEENDCSVGKAAMVQDLMERNARVREADRSSLCQMDMGALCREMDRGNYQTSFLVAKAGKLYQVKEDQPAGTGAVEQIPGETRTEAGRISDAEERETEAGSKAGEIFGDKEAGKSGRNQEENETVKEPEREESRPEEGTQPSEALENTEISWEGSEPTKQEASENVREPEVQETTVPSETSPVAPEISAQLPETTASTAEAGTPESSFAEPGMLTPVSPTPEETPALEAEPPQPTDPPPTTEPHTVGPGILEEVIPVG